MKQNDAQKRMQAAYKLLSDTKLFSLEKLESASVLVSGINPKVDKAFAVSIKALTKVERIRQGDVLTLSVEALPEETEAQKKRKKAIIFFLTNFKNLKSEIERVQSEINSHNEKTKTEQTASLGRIIGGAKGPFGIGTITALVIIGALFVINKPQSAIVQDQSVVAVPTKDLQLQGIIFEEKKIPLSEVISTKGNECDHEMHYHAKDHIAAKSIDEGIVYDPGGCGFGKVKDVKVVDL